MTNIMPKSYGFSQVFVQGKLSCCNSRYLHNLKCVCKPVSYMVMGL